MLCQNCGTTYPADARICTKCWQRLENEQLPQQRQPFRAYRLEYQELPLTCSAKPDRIDYEWHERVRAVVKELGREGWIPEVGGIW